MLVKNNIKFIPSDIYLSRKEDQTECFPLQYLETTTPLGRHRTRRRTPTRCQYPLAVLSAEVAVLTTEIDFPLQMDLSHV